MLLPSAQRSLRESNSPYFKRLNSKKKSNSNPKRIKMKTRRVKGTAKIGETINKTIFVWKCYNNNKRWRKEVHRQWLEHGEGPTFPPPFPSGTSQHLDSCPVALEIPRNGSKTELLCLQRCKWLALAASKPEIQTSRVLSRTRKRPLVTGS